MPKLPKWLADTMDKLYKNAYHPVSVSKMEYITPKLKRITLQGDFSNVDFVAGNAVGFRINDTDYRHYTLSGFNKIENTCEMLIYLHDMGVGSRWAESLKTGDKLTLQGPGGTLKYQSEFNKHFVFGDETSIGFMKCMEKAAREKGQDIFCLLEMQEAHETWESSVPSAVFVPASIDNPAQSAIALLKAEKPIENTQSTSDAFFYLTGRMKSIKALREFLLAKGIPPKQIKVEAYWNEGKQGL